MEKTSIYFNEHGFVKEKRIIQKPKDLKHEEMQRREKADIILEPVPEFDEEDGNERMKNLTLEDPVEPTIEERLAELERSYNEISVKLQYLLENCIVRNS